MLSKTNIIQIIALIMLLTGYSTPLVAEEAGTYRGSHVEIVESSSGYQLYLNGQPYEIKGAGFEIGEMSSLVDHGANSFRTWTTGDDPVAVLDEAHRRGLTVGMTLPMGAEHWNYDYSNYTAVREQEEHFVKLVERIKDHPALLFWILGNELNFDYTNPVVWNAVNNLAKRIKAIDPHHPLTTTLSNYDPELIATVHERAPEIVFLSFQLYADLINLPRYINRDKYTQPFMVTEWGAIGHWETGTTQWKAPVEQTSTEKAANYRKGYEQVIQGFPGQLIGNYVFLWGNKQEKTDTWYGMFAPDGSPTETIDTMQHLWTGGWPEDRSPQVKKMSLNKKTAFDNIQLVRNESYPANIRVIDPEAEELQISWEVRAEAMDTPGGGGYEDKPPSFPTMIQANSEGQGSTLVLADAPKGYYRLFASAKDPAGNTAHANIPFEIVENDSR